MSSIEQDVLDAGAGGIVSSSTEEKPSPASTPSTSSVVFEASTQTPTNETCDSPLFSQKGYSLKTSGHSLHALTNIQKMRQSGQLCDITLKVGLEKFRAHKVVLASVSPYFFAMFNGDMKEHALPEVELHDLDPTAIDLLVEYAYSGQIVITTDNVQVLLPASGLLQMHEVREACCRFLLRQLHPTNCLGIRSFADTHSCKELHHKSHIYALQNFQQVVCTEEFLLLPFDEVNDLISNSQLNISSEEDVFTAVLNWVKHDLAERNNEKLIRDNNDCRELLLEAMRYHLAPERRCALSSTRGGSLFAIHAECEVYNPKTDSWSSIAPMQWRRSRSGVTGLRRLLYVVGGYDGASDLATAECYNPLNNSWSAITPMGTKRSCLGICSFDGLIYVCGGYDGASCLSSMERFDPLTGIWFDPREGTWNPVPSMSSRRSSCGVAALNGHLYCIGGNDGTISTHEVVAIHNYIYALGGNDGSSSLNAVEQYDPKTNKWAVVCPMATRRSSVGAAVLECINIEHVLRQTRKPS
nr:unnamed protein product [Callosobruchus analis]